MSTIKFGPTGIGPIKDAATNLEMYHKLGFETTEILFTHGIYIKHKEDALKIKQAAKKFNISLSIHAPYFINLNSKEPEKIEASKKRILKCCEVGHWLGAKKIIFHPGFYSGMNSAETSIKIKKNIIELQKTIKKNKWDVKLYPEVMGKINVFGSIDEIGDLVNSTGCEACIDIAHILARYKKYEFEKIKNTFKMKNWQIHFSGIEFGDKGEKKHIITPPEEWKKVLKFLKGLNKNITLICESPDALNDTIVGKNIWEKIN